MHSYPALQIFGDCLGPENLRADQRAASLILSTVKEWQFVDYRFYLQQNLAISPERRG